MTTETSPTKATRNRAILRSYNYAALSGSIKDANSQAVLLSFDLSTLPAEVVQKLALSAAMGMIAGSGVAAHNDGEDVSAAMNETLAELVGDKIEFKDGVGVAMGGTLKRIARALVEMGKTYVKAPDGSTLTWAAGDIADAFAKMRELWAIKEDDSRTADGQRPESGRATVNRIKAIPDVAAKLASYAKGKGTVELG